MLIVLRSSAALAALMVGLAACSAEPAVTESSPEAAAATPATETAVTMPSANTAATPASLAAAAAPAPARPGVVEQPAAIATPAASPAAPAAAPEDDQHAGMSHAPGVTNHSLPIDRIKNFKLTDQTGKVHELYKMTDAKAIVLTMHTKGCPIGQQLMPDFKELQAKYEPKGVKFLMLNSNLYDTPKMIAEEVESFHSTIPVLKDADQSVGEPLGVERATETLVIQPGTWKILYQGPINDRVTYGRARAKAEKQYVGGVVDAMLAGQSVTPSYIAPEGCILVFENRKG